MSNTFAGVVELVSRLQRACGALGEHAGSNDIATSVPNLWNLLPSVVVIGGQVRMLLGERLTDSDIGQR